jgi:hypothetical protein
MPARLIPCFWLACMVAATVGCDLVTFEHPIAAEADSQYDERLQGVWRMEALQDDPAGEAKAAEEQRAEQVAIGKVPGKPNLLQFASMEVKDDGEIAIQRLDVPAVKLGEQNFLSYSLSPDLTSSPYLVLRYEFTDDDQVNMYLPDHDAFSFAIRSKKLAGTVKMGAKPVDDPNKDRSRNEVRVSATSAELRAFLSTDGGKLFGAKPAFRLRRVK